MKKILMILLLLTSSLVANIKSTSGQIKFNTQSDSQPEMILNGIGLGIGISPSSNLHVDGNILVSEALSVGGSETSHSTLNINGTLSFGIESISSDTTLSGNTFIRADSSSNDIVLTLPTSADVLGRSYKIKKLSRNGNVFISGNLIDGDEYALLGSGEMGFIELISTGTEEWSIVSHYGKQFWSPEDLDTTIWLDAFSSRSININGGLVYQWDDQSGRGNHATQSNTLKQAVYDSASQEMLFSGDDVYQVTNDAFNGLQNPCVVAVTRFDASSSWANAIASYRGETNIGWQLRQRTSNINDVTFTIRTTGGADDPDPSNTTNTVNFIATGYRKDSDTRIIRHNGTQTSIIDGTDTGTITYGSSISAIGGRYLGTTEENSAGYLNGAIKEIVVADGLTDEEIEMLEGYMAWRWDMQGNLPSDHPYKYERPTK